MAGNSKKFQVKNGLNAQNISFVDSIVDANNTITIEMLGTDTLSFEGDAGQLFSISDDLTGTIFSVNDISGIPSFEVDADGEIRLAEFDGQVLIGTSTNNNTDILQVAGSISANVVKADLEGNANTASALETSRTIELTGDVTGDTTFDGSANASITTTIDGNNHTHVVSNITDFGSSVNTAIDARVTQSFVNALNVDAETLDGIDSASFLRSDQSDTLSGDLTITGNLTVSGTTTTLNTTDLEVKDAFITLNSGQATPANDIGLLFQRYSSANSTNYNIAVTWEEGADKFVIGTTAEDGTDNDITFASEWLSINSSGVVTANGSGITSVNAAALQGSSYSDITDYVDGKAANAYANAVADASGTDLSETANSSTVTIASSSGTDAIIEAANSTNAGILTATTQTIGGDKTFSGNVIISTGKTISGNGVSITSVNAASVGGNTAATLRTYSETKAGEAYSNATSYADDKAANAYSNATSYADTAAGTAYTNAVAYADAAANDAYANAIGEISNAAIVIGTSGIATGGNTFNLNQPSGETITINVPNTNLTSTTNTTAVLISSSTGTNATVTAANTTKAGVVTTGTQTFAGDKTFTGVISGNGASITSVNAASLNGNTVADLKTDLTTSVNSTVVTIQSSNGTDANILAANSTTAGIITTGTQTISGNKNFTGVVNASSFEGDGTGITNVDAATVGGNTALDLRTFANGVANDAYTNAIGEISNATITISSGSGLSGNGDFNLNQSGGETIILTHADTSSVANSDNADGTVLQDIFFDGFGHVQSVATINLDSRYLPASYSETDTLDDVTGRGSSTNNAISTGTITTTKVTGLSAPTSGSDAVNKTYVDELAEGLQTKPAAEVISTTNLTATYNNGANGVGATLTSTSNGAFPAIDGITVSSTTPGENGILVGGQTNAAHNGRYVLTTVGDGSNPWVLTRCGVCDEPDEIAGAFIFIKQGTDYAGTGWVQIVDDPTTFTVGTDDIDVIQFSQAGTYTANGGIDLTGLNFSLESEIAGDYLFHTAVGSAQFELNVNATSNGTGNTIVLYNANGSFSVNAVSANTLSGNGTGVTSVDAAKLNTQLPSYYLDYDNFTNTPTIGNGTITINTAGIATGGDAFTLNQVGSETITITVPGTNLTSTAVGGTITITSSTGTGAGANTVLAGANSTVAGLVNTGAQTFSGNKTFTGVISGNGASVTSVNAAALQGDSLADIKSYADTAADNAYTNAVADATGITNLTESVNSTVYTILSDTGVDVNIQGAGGGRAGIVTAETQTFEGDKTFEGNMTFSNNVLCNDVVTINSTMSVINGNDIYIPGSGQLQLSGTGLSVYEANLYVSSGDDFIIEKNSVIRFKIDFNDHIVANTDVVPSANSTHLLGNTTNRWDQLFVDDITVTANVTAVNLSGNGSSVTSVNAAAVGGNTASTLRTYSETTAATAYSNAVADAVGTTNLTTSVNTSTVTINSDTGTDADIIAANNTQAGIVTTLTQSFAGNKTFNDVVIAGGVSVLTSLGSTGNLTVGNNATVTNTLTLSGDYTETVSSSTNSTTINLDNGTIFKITITSATTITLPSSVAGKSFVIIMDWQDNKSITWAGGTSIEWPGGSAPSLTSSAGKVDILSFFQDGSVTFGIPVALDFS